MVSSFWFVWSALSQGQLIQIAPHQGEPERRLPLHRILLFATIKRGPMNSQLLTNSGRLVYLTLFRRTKPRCRRLWLLAHHTPGISRARVAGNRRYGSPGASVRARSSTRMRTTSPIVGTTSNGAPSATAASDRIFELEDLLRAERANALGADLVNCIVAARVTRSTWEQRCRSGLDGPKGRQRVPVQPGSTPSSSASTCA